ncbi:adenosylcobinamide amidohydrolase [Sphaerisporangium sp. NBC_01403]|uniref:adenosylcobinamide amidohydrolase n=1 Tax=Sphaerisporangium sp. NBC_01403 TaxID=2903599 RepID=UPI003246E692
MLSLSHRHEDGARLASLLWEFGPGWRMISSAMVGGGIGPGEWVLNAQVVGAYSRMDPIDHLLELAPAGRPGVGMMTAASVAHYTRASDGGAEAVATVGLRVPTWAASPEGVPDPELRPERGDPAPRPERGDLAPRLQRAGLAPPPERVGPASPSEGAGLVPRPASPVPSPTAPGTINIIVAVPVAMSDAALVNTVMTVTEAKSQALAEAGYACTGTASDAVCVAVRAEGPEELFGGPRSTWGSRIARAVHHSVLNGAHAWADVVGFVPAAHRG